MRADRVFRHDGVPACGAHGHFDGKSILGAGEEFQAL